MGDSYKETSQVQWNVYTEYSPVRLAVGLPMLRFFL